MTSSAEVPLPPALPSMWRLCRLGYRNEPALMLVALALALLAAVPDALLALWLMLLGNGLLRHDSGLVYAAAAGLGASACATWLLRVVSTRVQRRFRDRVTIALEAHVARLQAGVESIAHHERPEYLDRLSVLREQVFVLDHMYMSLFTTLGWLVRLAITLVLLASVSPLLLTLALFAAPTIFTAAWRPAVARRVQESVAVHARLAQHLFMTATTAAAAKEVRVLGLADRLALDRRNAWQHWYAPIAATRTASAWWHCAGWAVFGAGYVGAIWYTSARPGASPGQVLLVLAAGARLCAYVSATVGEIGFLRGIWLDGARRLAWLEDYAASFAAGADVPVPGALTRGITLEAVSFSYPGSSVPALRDIDLHLPAGSVVALVGENGAGKSTLVKLLTRLYRPTKGRILVDGVDLARMDAGAWRARASGAYQDFFRFELLASSAVGVGELARLDDEAAVTTAVGRAGAGDVIAGLPAGLATQLGATWPDGVEVSFGQWQKLALARGYMRDEPLLLVLDEPTAALDAQTEHDLFARYAAGARRGLAGGITVLVSHRFSTVRMADLIVVLDGAHLVEVGSHDELVAAGGRYAQLYGMQAAAYR